MKKKKDIYKTISLILIIFVIILISIFISIINTKNNIENKKDNFIQKEYSNITIEIYHFHGKNQCFSCIAVGDLAEKTINTYFKEEINSKKLKFAHINAELNENSELVKKYGVTGSSLWIGSYLDGKFHKEENIRVWYKINNEQDYMDYLKNEIEKRLNGDLS